MSERTDLCGFCGTDFTVTHYRQRYCNCTCYEAAAKVRRAAQTAARPRKARACQGCSADISDLYRNTLFCHECTSTPQLHTSCAVCAKDFGTPLRRKFCSRRCQGLYPEKPEYPRTCVACGEDFVTFDPRPTTCGKSCRAWFRRNPGVARVLACVCEYCSQPFTARVGGQKFCSRACAGRPSDARRRASARNVRVEDVSKDRLAQRDKWICQICEKRVDKNIVHPDPMSSSIDHIVPISRGGEHSYANTQLAHLICNVRKGNRTPRPVQLALV